MKPELTNLTSTVKPRTPLKSNATSPPIPRADPEISCQDIAKMDIPPGPLFSRAPSLIEIKPIRGLEAGCLLEPWNLGFVGGVESLSPEGFSALREYQATQGKVDFTSPYKSHKEAFWREWPKKFKTKVRWEFLCASSSVRLRIGYLPSSMTSNLDTCQFSAIVLRDQARLA